MSSARIAAERDPRAPSWRVAGLRALLCVLLAYAVAPAFAASANAASATLPAPLQALARAIRGAPMRCVPFEQRKHIASLQRELVFRGEMTVTADRRVHWRLQSPVRAEYQFLADGAWRRTGNAPWARLAVPDAASRVIHDMLAALLDLDPVALTRQFDLRVTGAAPLVFDAVPRDARLRRVITKVTVQGEQRIDRLRVLEASGNWSDYSFTPPAAGAACEPPATPNG